MTTFLSIFSSLRQSRLLQRSLARISTICALAMVVVATVFCAAAGPTPAGGLPVTTIGPPTGPFVHEVAQTTTLAGTGTGPATATCPQGEVALGGGWELPSRASGGTPQALPAAR